MKPTRLLLLLPLALLAGCASPDPRPDLVDIQKYTIAAERGDAWGQYQLGQAYQTHWRPTEANNWFRKAALNGQRDAMYALGNNYLNGTGTTQNSLEAFAWFSVGAAQDQLAARNAAQSLASRMTMTEVEKGKQRAAELVAQIAPGKLMYEDAKVSAEKAKDVATTTAVLGTAAGKAEQATYFTDRQTGSNPDRTSYGKDQPMRKGYSAPAAPKTVEVVKPISTKAEAVKPVTTGTVEELKPKN
ncbi:MAG: hypothetical protein RL380_448 [Verrucomicrobiota bacterium]